MGKFLSADLGWATTTVQIAFFFNKNQMISTHQQPPYLNFHRHVWGGDFFRSPNSAFTLTSRILFPLISLPLRCGEVKQR
jgi:hypothetical protein